MGKCAFFHRTNQHAKMTDGPYVCTRSVQCTVCKCMQNSPVDCDDMNNFFDALSAPSIATACPYPLGIHGTHPRREQQLRSTTMIKMTPTSSAHRQRRSDDDPFADTFCDDSSSAKEDDLDFDQDDSEGDCSWASEQFTSGPHSSHHRRPTVHNLNNSLHEKLTIQPKTTKIDDDDESWFSEASDMDGNSSAQGPTRVKNGVKKKRTKRKIKQTSLAAGSRMMRGPIPADGDNLLQQHRHTRAGETTDEGSSEEEEDLFKFTANFDFFGTPPADPFALDGANDSSVTGSIGPKACVAPSIESLSLSTKKPLIKKNSTNMPRVKPGMKQKRSVCTSVSPPKGAPTRRRVSPQKARKGPIYNNAATVGHHNAVVVADGERETPNEKQQVAWLEAIPAINKARKTRASPEGNAKPQQLPVNGNSNTQPHSPRSPVRDKKVISSLAAAAALMRSSITQRLATSSAHSDNSNEDEAPPPRTKAAEMYLPATPFDPLSASEHGICPKQGPKGTKPPLRRASSLKVNKTNASTSTASLLNASGSFQSSARHYVDEYPETSGGADMTASNAPQHRLVRKESSDTFSGDEMGPIASPRKLARRQNKSTGGIHGSMRPCTDRNSTDSSTPTKDPPRRRINSGKCSLTRNQSASKGDRVDTSHANPGPTMVEKEAAEPSQSKSTGGKALDTALLDELLKILMPNSAATIKQVGVSSDSQDGTGDVRIACKLKPKPGLAVKKRQPGHKDMVFLSETMETLVGPKRVMQTQASGGSMPAVESFVNRTGFGTKPKVSSKGSSNSVENGSFRTKNSTDITRVTSGQGPGNALDQHMVKRRTRKVNGASGAASLAGHELQKKKVGSLASLQRQAGPVRKHLGCVSVDGGLVRKTSGSASVSGGPSNRRPVTRRPRNPSATMRKKPDNQPENAQ